MQKPPLSEAVYVLHALDFDLIEQAFVFGFVDHAIAFCGAARGGAGNAHSERVLQLVIADESAGKSRDHRVARADGGFHIERKLRRIQRFVAVGNQRAFAAK